MRHTTRFLLAFALAFPAAAASTTAAAAPPTHLKVKKRNPKNAVTPHYTSLDGLDLMAAPKRTRTVEYDARGRLTVVITDTKDHYVYGVLMPRDGSPAKVCTRQKPTASHSTSGGGGAGKCNFDMMLSGKTAIIQILAVPKSNTAADDKPKPPVYGPVVVVKPKG
jgi:hypothetical protein